VGISIYAFGVVNKYQIIVLSNLKYYSLEMSSNATICKCQILNQVRKSIFLPLVTNSQIIKSEVVVDKKYVGMEGGE
jgi:hypothetical protein